MSVDTALLEPETPIPRQCFERGGYVLDGPPERFLISATRALSIAGLSVYPERTGAAADSAAYSQRLGTDVHAAVAEIELHGAAFSAPPEVEGYCDAWRRFKREHEYRSLLVETIAPNNPHGYACRPDQVGESFGVPMTLDLKTGSMSRHYMLQTAAQVMAVRRTWPGQFGKLFARAALELRSDGRYFFREHDKAMLLVHFQQFIAAVVIARYLLDGKDPGPEVEHG